MIKVPELIATQVNNLTDARYFAAWNVNVLAFNIDPNSSESVDMGSFVELVSWVEGPKFIGSIFHRITKAEILSLAETFNIDQIHIGPELDSENWQNEKEIEFIQELSIKHSATDRIQLMLNNIPENVVGLILDFRENEKRFLEIESQINSWPNVKLYIKDHWNLSALEKFCHKGHFGICVEGGNEEKTGFKSYDDLDVIFDYLETLS